MCGRGFAVIGNHADHALAPKGAVCPACPSLYPNSQHADTRQRVAEAHRSGARSSSFMIGSRRWGVAAAIASSSASAAAARKASTVATFRGRCRERREMEAPCKG